MVSATQTGTGGLSALTGIVPIILWCVGIFVVILLNFFISTMFQKAAESKGFHGPAYFWAPFLCSIAGYFLIMALPDRGKTEAESADGVSERINNRQLDDLIERIEDQRKTDPRK